MARKRKIRRVYREVGIQVREGWEVYEGWWIFVNVIDTFDTYEEADYFAEHGETIQEAARSDKADLHEIEASEGAATETTDAVDTDVDTYDGGGSSYDGGGGFSDSGGGGVD